MQTYAVFPLLSWPLVIATKSSDWAMVVASRGDMVTQTADRNKQKTSPLSS